MSGFTMDNHEEILDALTAFGKNPNPIEIPSVLEQYLNSVAKNGETIFPWTQLKPLILRKMELVITELRRNLASENIPTRPNVENVRFDVIHARIIDSLHKFNGAPFTIQRLCELLIDPKRHYKRSDKFMRGLEKNVLVVSTVDPFGRKVVSELGNKPVLNGILDINGSYPPRDSALSVPLPPVPGWVNTTAASRNAGTGVMSSAVDGGNKTGHNLDTLDKDSDGLVSNSLTVSGTQVYSDQGDPLAVHSEEVVEETVVTMDTGEVSSVVTDGGEALADRDMESGDIEREDDRDASSSFSSSSSSSSEELSTSSDSIENGLRCSTSPLDMASGNRINEDVTAMDENRPWAAFAQDIKQQEDLGTTSLSSSSSNQPVIGDTSGVSSSSPQHNTLSSADPSSSPSSSSLPPENESSLLSASTTTSTSTSKAEEEQQEESPDDVVCAPTNELSAAPSDQSDWQQQQQSSCDESSSTTADVINQSFGFDPSTTTPTTSSQHTTDMATATDKLISSSTSTVISTSTVTTTTTSNNNSKNTSSSSDIHTSSPLIDAAGSSDGAVIVPQPPSYAQVVASSTTDKTSSSSSIEQISPYSSNTETVPACDSVAGLERLVGSMEQSLSSSSSSSSSSSVCPSSTSSSPTPSSSHPSTTTSHNNNSSAVTTSSLPECSPAPMDSVLQTTLVPSSSQCFSSEDGEPASKRPRLSLDEASMEEDCISTSGDSCMEQEGDKREEDRLAQCEDEEDGCSSVDSSCVTEQEGQLQQRDAPDQDDVPMEEEGEVTTGSIVSVVSGEEDKENGCGIESTSGDNNVVDGGVDKADESVATNGAEGKPDISCAESSDVSTTDGDANQTKHHVDDCGE